MLDHKNLKYFREPQKLNARQARWYLMLQEYDFLVTTLRVNSGCNERQRLEGNKAKSKLVKHKEYRVLLRYL
jgi:hypothetical protein